MSDTNNSQRYIRVFNKDLSNMLVFPDQDTDKYKRGTCIVVAGSKKFPGAAILSSQAAEKAGSGYTKLFTNKSGVNKIPYNYPTIPVDNFNNLISSNMLQNSEVKPVAYLVGPGFIPNNDKNIDILLTILNGTNAPVIIDGGALSAITKKSIRKALFKRFANNLTTVLTPHYGEAVKLYSYYKDDKLNKSLRNSDFVYMLADLTNSIIVLKGPNTYICDSQKAYLMRKGTEALAKAGTGDVLAGLIAGTICQNKISTFDACVISSIIHAEAGSLAARDLSTISVSAKDVLNYIPAAIQAIKKSS